MINLDESEHMKLVKLLQDGFSVKKISPVFKCSPGELLSYVKKKGGVKHLISSNINQNENPIFIKNLVIKFRESGLSTQLIMQKVGRSKTTVNRILRDHKKMREQ